MVTREERFRRRLAAQSAQIERVLLAHQLPTRVAGGVVKESLIRFDVQGPLAAGLARLDHLKRDLQAVLGAVALQLTGRDEQWQIAIPRPEAEGSVALFDLLEEWPPLPPLTAALGVADDDRPVLLNLATRGASHAFIAGDHGCGKSSLLRTIGLSLALGNRQSALQLVLIDGAAMLPGGVPGLRPLVYLPHTLGPVLEDPDGAVEALNFFAAELSFRRTQRIQHPHLVLLIDEVVGLLAADEAGALPPLITLLQQGADAGIHVIMSSDTPGDDAVVRLLGRRMPLRLVGFCANGADVQAAAGRGLDPDQLPGECGGFVAVAHAEQTVLQAAYVDGYDFGLAVEHLRRDGRGTLLAAPLAPDWAWSAGADDDDEGVGFTFESLADDELVPGSRPASPAAGRVVTADDGRRATPPPPDVVADLRPASPAADRPSLAPAADLSPLPPAAERPVGTGLRPTLFASAGRAAPPRRVKLPPAPPVVSAAPPADVPAHAATEAAPAAATEAPRPAAPPPALGQSQPAVAELEYVDTDDPVVVADDDAAGDDTPWTDDGDEEIIPFE